MRAFNRIVMIVVGAALALGGATAAAFALDTQGFQLAALEQALAPAVAGVQDVLRQAQDGALPAATQLLLMVVAVTGAALLFFEFRPGRSHLVPLAEGAYATEPAVAREIELSASEVPGTLDVSADVRGSTRGRSKIQVDAFVREGVDEQATRAEVEKRAQEAVERLGITRAGMQVNLATADPRDTKARVR
jgi:hypothetical protein